MVSIILPTFNEAENLKKLIPRIVKAMKGREFEIIVVDDQSTDGTADVAVSICPDCNIRVFEKEVRQGIGDALAVGYDMAEGDIILSMDADNQIDAGEIPKLLEFMEGGGFDMVIGSKYLNKSSSAIPHSLEVG